MIAITTMMVVATIQSSVNKMIPKTAYYKMIDYWLLYTFNIIISSWSSTPSWTTSFLGTVRPDCKCVIRYRYHIH